MLRVPKKLWVLCLLLALIVAAAVWPIRPNEQRNIRYQVDGDWTFKWESKYIGKRPSGRYVSVSVGAGFTNEGNWFRVVGSKLQIGAFPNDPARTVFELPENLLNSRPWSVVASADGQRVVCVNERGIVVWRAKPPHELMHSWAITEEPLAGIKIGTDRDGDTPYDRHELVIAYRVSPDGRLASVYAAIQRGSSYERPRPDGIVIVRDLESGQDITQLVHPMCGPVIKRVAWSNDSRRLATFAPKTQQVTVWDVTTGESVGQIKEFAEQLALSHDGSLVYTVFTGSTSSGTVGPDRPRTVVHRVADGTRVGSRKIGCNQLVLSPDGKYLAASTGFNFELMQSSTLENVWSSPGGGGQHITFRRDGTELALLGVGVGGYVATAHVKAWNAADGVVVLDASTNAGSGTTYGVGFGKDDAIWTYGPSHWNRFKLVQ